MDRIHDGPDRDQQKRFLILYRSLHDTRWRIWERHRSERAAVVRHLELETRFSRHFEFTLAPAALVPSPT